MSVCRSCLLSGIPAFCAELELRYAAIERVIADQLFSQEGRLYVRGNKATKCKFAYLESPHVGAMDGRLRVTARFSGRTALDMFGGCVGLGDSFDFTLIAVPIVKNGALAFNEVNVSTPRDSFYIRRVRQALDQQLFARFQDRSSRSGASSAGAGAGAGAAKPLYQQELASFDLRDVRVQPDALVLVMDFRLVVK